MIQNRVQGKRFLVRSLCVFSLLLAASAAQKQAAHPFDPILMAGSPTLYTRPYIMKKFTHHLEYPTMYQDPAS